MYEFAIIWDWLAFAVRWLHVITGIAWIGSSFYFVALDLGLRKAPDLPPGAYGEEWQVHGGGFYHIQKYLVAPERLPEHLTWFKWESYATWLSGFAMLADRLLRRGGPLPGRPGGAGRGALGGDPDLDGLARRRLGALRRALQVEARREPDDVDGASSSSSWWRWRGGTPRCSPGGRRSCISGRSPRRSCRRTSSSSSSPTRRSWWRTCGRGGCPTRSTGRSPSCARPTTTT